MNECLKRPLLKKVNYRPLTSNFSSNFVLRPNFRLPGQQWPAFIFWPEGLVWCRCGSCRRRWTRRGSAARTWRPRGASSRPGSLVPWRATNRSPSTGKDDILNRCQSCGWTWRPRGGSSRPGSLAPYTTNRSPSTGKDNILNPRQSAECLIWTWKPRGGAWGQAHRRHGA